MREFIKGSLLIEAPDLPPAQAHAPGDRIDGGNQESYELVDGCWRRVVSIAVATEDDAEAVMWAPPRTGSAPAEHLRPYRQRVRADGVTLVDFIEEEWDGGAAGLPAPWTVRQGSAVIGDDHLIYEIDAQIRWVQKKGLLTHRESQRAYDAWKRHHEAKARSAKRRSSLWWRARDKAGYGPDMLPPAVKPGEHVAVSADTLERLRARYPDVLEEAKLHRRRNTTWF